MVILNVHRVDIFFSNPKNSDASRRYHALCCGTRKNLEKNIFFLKKMEMLLNIQLKETILNVSDKDYIKNVLELIGEVTFGEYYNKETPDGKEVYKLASDPTQETTDYELAQKMNWKCNLYRIKRYN